MNRTVNGPLFNIYLSINQLKSAALVSFENGLIYIIVILKLLFFILSSIYGYKYISLYGNYSPISNTPSLYGMILKI